MIKKILFVLVGIILLATTNIVSAQTPTLTVTSPVAGNNWVAGSTHTLTWDGIGIPDTATMILRLMQPDGVTPAPAPFGNIVSLTSTAGIHFSNKSYTLTVPNPTPGTVSPWTYRLTASGFVPAVSSISGQFNITPIPTFTISAPTVGAQWGRDQSHTVTWQNVPSSGPSVRISWETPVGGFPGFVKSGLTANGGTLTYPATDFGSSQYAVPNGNYRLKFQVETGGVSSSPVGNPFYSGTFSVVAAGTVPSTKFSINGRVVSNAAVNVRDAANGNVLGTQASGQTGTVIGGPTNAGGSDWWQINYDTGFDGWSAETLLDPYTSGGNGDFDIPGVTPPVWHNPPGDPTDCDDVNTPGCWPPINVSSLGQWKGGVLGADALVTQAFRFLTSPAAGYVLTSDEDGYASWQRPTGEGGGIPLTSCPTAGQIPKWNGNAWDCAGDDTGGSPTGGNSFGRIEVKAYAD